MASISYEKVLTITCISAALWGFGEAHFEITVETEYKSCYAYELDPMCDAQKHLTFKTGRQQITVVGTDRYHNQNDDFKPLSVILEDKLAREVIHNILDDEQNLLWFTKDRLSYAAKYGKAM